MNAHVQAAVKAEDNASKAQGTTNLDNLMEELNEDDLRNISGGVTERPKGGYDTN